MKKLLAYLVLLSSLLFSPDIFCMKNKSKKNQKNHIIDREKDWLNVINISLHQTQNTFSVRNPEDQEKINFIFYTGFSEHITNELAALFASFERNLTTGKIQTEYLIEKLQTNIFNAIATKLENKFKTKLHTNMKTTINDFIKKSPETEVLNNALATSIDLIINFLEKLYKKLLNNYKKEYTQIWNNFETKINETNKKELNYKEDEPFENDEICKETTILRDAYAFNRSKEIDTQRSQSANSTKTNSFIKQPLELSQKNQTPNKKAIECAENFLCKHIKTKTIEFCKQQTQDTAKMLFILPWFATERVIRGLTNLFANITQATKHKNIEKTFLAQMIYSHMAIELLPQINNTMNTVHKIQLSALDLKFERRIVKFITKELTPQETTTISEKEAFDAAIKTITLFLGDVYEETIKIYTMGKPKI
ncbi:MAG: hypothetical protein ABH827_05665 [bacterium]